MINIHGRKERVELLAVLLSLGLAVVKGIVAFRTGTLALLASALDSLLDFFVSGVNLLTIAFAQKQADEDHAFGHEKAESLAGLLQSLFILGSAGYLLYSAFGRFAHPSELHKLPEGMFVVALSMGTSFWIAYRLKAGAKVTGSMVLRADALHYSMDLYTQGGILIAFVLISLTGWRVLDPLITIPIVFYIAYQSFHVGKAAVDELMDRETSPTTHDVVQGIVERHRPQVMGMHNFKTRRAGPKRFVQFHIEMSRDLSFLQVHEISEQIVGEIRLELGNVQVIVHPDPEGVGLDQSDLS